MYNFHCNRNYNVLEKLWDITCPPTVATCPNTTLDMRCDSGSNYMSICATLLLRCLTQVGKTVTSAIHNEESYEFRKYYKYQLNTS